MKLLCSFGKHQPDIEELSAHLDGEITAARGAELEGHIAGCDACRIALDGLRDARTLLAAMPVEATPRSFRLRQAQVDVPAKPTGAGFGATSLMRWAPALSGAAAVVFIIVVGADVLTQSSSSNDLAASRSESTGIIAADGAMPEASMSKTGDDAAAGAALGGPITPPDTGTFVPTLGLEDDGSGVSEYQVPAPGELEGTQGDPTGSPPDGDAPVPDTRFESEQGSEGPAGSAPTGDFLPPTALANEVATQATNDALVERQVPGPTGTPAEVQAFSDNGTDDEGNRTGLRIVQIAAAAVAVLAGAAFVATRWRGKGI